LDMNMAGLMIEVHHDPARALSDKEQQLTPDEFDKMMGSLLFRSSTSGDIGFINHLEELRNRIDSIDHQLSGLLAARMRMSEEMGEYKCRSGVTVCQVERGVGILESRTQHGISEGLDSEFVGKVIRMIH